MYRNVPELDLHGETSITVFVPLKGFIYENYCLKNKVIAVIHGHSSFILKNKIHEILKEENKYVDKYMLDIDNLGRTLIFLKE